MAKLLLYGEIGWDVMAKDVVEYLDEVKDEAVELHVNSPGGDVFEAIAIRSAILAHKDITIVVDALAASAAAIISLCGKPLIVADYSRIMLHSASTMAWGNSKEMEEQLNNLKSIDDDLAAMIAGKMGKDPQEIRDQYFDGKDHWLSAAEVVAMGVAEKSEAPKTEDRTPSVYDCINGRKGSKIQDINKLKNDCMKKLENFKEVAAFADCQNEDDVLAKVNEQAAELDETKKTIEAKDCEISEKDAKIAEQAAKIAELEAEVANNEAEKAAAQAAADEKVVTDAIEAGKISENMKEAFINMMKADRENTTKVIESLPTPKNGESVNDFIKGNGVNDAKKSAFEAELERIASRK